jgi:CRISPR-associated protein Cmr5
MNETQTRTRRTPDQRRANHAWEAVQAVLTEHPHQVVNGKKLATKEARDFHGQAKKLPTRILAAGLGQALAFLNAKNYTPLLLKALEDWILNKPETFDPNKPLGEKPLLQKIVTEWTSDDLRRQTDEALAYLLWLNRFTDAEINRFAEGGGDAGPGEGD